MTKPSILSHNRSVTVVDPKESIPKFVYPEDLEVAGRWRREERITLEELQRCFRVQRSDPPPPRTLAEIAENLHLTDRLTPSEATARFEAESARPLRRDRTVAEGAIREDVDYSIVRKIGEGGQGEVYLAQQNHPTRLAVLKILPSKSACDGAVILRFLEEALLLEMAACEGVVDLHEYGKTGEEFFLAMEWVVGEALDAYLRRMVRLDPGEVIEIALSLTQTLEAVSAGGVVHCDLKPSNVVLPHRGQRTKLIDFGAAVRSGRPQSAEGGWCGSPPYMAPEQFQGAPLTPQADMYSLGIACFQLLTGALPFQSDNPVHLGRRHLLEPLPSILHAAPDVPVRLAGIIKRLCAKNPDDRHPSFKELEKDLIRA